MMKPLRSSGTCSLVLRYIEELSGHKRVQEILMSDSIPTIIVPSERGAQIHVDCPQQHTDLLCNAPKNVWRPVRCHGTLQGHHKYLRSYDSDVQINIAASKSCLAAKALVCDARNSSVACPFAPTCTSVTHTPSFPPPSGVSYSKKLKFLQASAKIWI